MMGKSWSITGDLSPPLIAMTLALAAFALVLLALELRRGVPGGGRGGTLVGLSGVVLSGVLSVVLVTGAVLRPVSILSRGSIVGPKVIVLFDHSQSIDLPEAGPRRRHTEREAAATLKQSFPRVRFSFLGFGSGPATPWDPTLSPDDLASSRSDLEDAFVALARSTEERASSWIVISDGRLDRPAGEPFEGAIRTRMREIGLPVHAVALSTRTPRDASIRAVRTAGASVAHQAFPLTIEVGCAGGLACGDLPVQVSQWIDRGAPLPLAEGTAHIENGIGKVELSVTLDRAGPRIIEVTIKPPDGDEIPDNNRRLLTLEVTRDRVRVLHVAGRPTYDVRALRTWLKSDASVDVVAFFILRTATDSVNASDDDLALIPFPVHELFSDYLPTFDAVVLQDFNAEPYHLLQHLPALARYVEKGGGLIMVGGTDSFLGGNYAGTRLAHVLPVELDADATHPSFDPAAFLPRYTSAARGAPMLGPLRALLGDALPEMSGANFVGDARPSSIVLMTHPTIKTATGASMPLLTLGEQGEGRSIALAIDGSYRLEYGKLASGSSGRAHGALWDGLLGWLMRDPRYEPAQIEPPPACIAGIPSRIRARPLAVSGKLSFDLVRLGDGVTVAHEERPELSGSEPVELQLGPLDAGGYSARVRIGNGPVTRRDFACERGGDEWADSRPDPSRLKAIASTSGGMFVDAAHIEALPLNATTEIAVERRVSPWVPPWIWTLVAAVALGSHWVLRRRYGLV